MIPQVRFISRQIRPAREGIGIQQVRVECRQRGSHYFLQVAADDIVEANGTRCQVEGEKQGVPVQGLAELLGVKVIQSTRRSPQLLQHYQRDIHIFGKDHELLVASVLLFLQEVETDT